MPLVKDATTWRTISPWFYVPSKRYSRAFKSRIASGFYVRNSKGTLTQNDVRRLNFDGFFMILILGGIFSLIVCPVFFSFAFSWIFMLSMHVSYWTAFEETAYGFLKFEGLLFCAWLIWRLIWNMSARRSAKSAIWLGDPALTMFFGYYDALRGSGLPRAQNVIGAEYRNTRAYKILESHLDAYLKDTAQPWADLKMAKDTLGADHQSVVQLCKELNEFTELAVEAAVEETVEAYALDELDRQRQKDLEEADRKSDEIKAGMESQRECDELIRHTEKSAGNLAGKNAVHPKNSEFS